MDELLADFLTETQEGLVALDAALVRLERAPDDAATLAEAFRVVHTIKGTCGFLGLARLQLVAHAGENLLGRWRDATLPVTREGISLILRAVDAMRRIVTAIGQTGSEPEGDDSWVIAALDAAAAGQAGDEFMSEPAAAATSPLATPNPPEAAAAPAADALLPHTDAAAPQTIRVAVEVLETLRTLASALALTRNQLLQHLRRGADASLAAPLQRLSQITTAPQEGVMKTRMQPIGQAWAKLPRPVRDLGEELGKRIALVKRGAYERPRPAALAG